MTKVITIFSCANDLHNIAIIRWRIAGADLLELGALELLREEAGEPVRVRGHLDGDLSLEPCARPRPYHFG